jgi:hypothetical protein
MELHKWLVKQDFILASRAERKQKWYGIHVIQALIVFITVLP